MIRKILQMLKTEPSYKARFASLWKELVPPAYEAETLQGELLRCIGNLDDEARRNGNMNWDSEDRKAVNFLKKHLPDPAVFSSEEQEKIRECLKTIGDAGSFKNNEVHNAYEELDFVVCKVVDFCEKRADLIYIKEQEDYIGHY